MMIKLFKRHCFVRWKSRSFHCTPQYHKNNVILMGSPGSGKTTIGHLLGMRLAKNWIDIDNDYLEKYWGMPVSKKLKEVGPDQFVETEGEAMMHFEAENAIVSLTGSNPMHKESYERIRKLGTVVFVDVLSSDIVKRQGQMRTNRIVGTGGHDSLRDILKYRQQFYEGHYDIRVICHEGEAPGSITTKITKALEEDEAKSQFVSTRGAFKDGSDYGQAPTFNQVVLRGLAPDGGLYVPKYSVPSMCLKTWERLVPLSFHERALRILEQWIHRCDISPAVLSEMVRTTYSIENFNCHKVFPVLHLHRNMYVTEMFHGPTASFKDGALQLMPKFFQHALDNRKKPEHRYLILVATSGDTGSAVLDGFSKLGSSGSVDVLVLYPEKGISSVQKAQMVNAQGENIHVAGVKSDFDYCQFTIKRVFKDKEFCEHISNEYGVLLSAANSLNWGRLLPQVVYHASSYLELVKQGVIVMGDEVDLCVPTGNFGNILASYYAKCMGIPYRTLICASNANNVLTEFFNSGTYNLTRRTLHATSSPAIDILKSSNVERFLYHMSGNNHRLVRKCMHDLDAQKTFSVPSKLLDSLRDIVFADWSSEQDTYHSIQSTLHETGYLMDPHTAVGKTVADRLNNKDCPLLMASTAHYAKFPEDILQAMDDKSFLKSTKNNPVDMISHLAKMASRPPGHKGLLETVQRTPTRDSVIDASLDSIKQEIENYLHLRIRK